MDAAAVELVKTTAQTAMLSRLSELLRRLSGEPVVLLRAMPGDFSADRDDVDLLLSKFQRSALLDAALEAALNGKLQLRIRQHGDEKVQLTLFDADGASRLEVDLWTEFSQLPHFRRMCISAERLQKLTRRDSPACGTGRNSAATFASSLPGAVPLSAELNFCLLVLHIQTKGKSLASPVVRERLFDALNQLRIVAERKTQGRSTSVSSPCTSDVPLLLEVCESLLQATSIPQGAAAIAETCLLRRLEQDCDDGAVPLLQRRGRRQLAVAIRKWFMVEVPCIAVVGSDGVGKSAVCNALSASRRNSIRLLTSKKLYRRSWVYQLFGGAAKRLSGLDRCRLDDLAAIPITLRACLSLWTVFAVLLLKRVWKPFSGTAGSFFRDEESGLVPEPSAATGKSESFPGRRQTHSRCTDRSGSAEGAAAQDAEDQTSVSHPNFAELLVRSALLLDRSVAGFLIRDRKSEAPDCCSLATYIEPVLPPVTTVLLTVPFDELSRRKQEMCRSGHRQYQQLLIQQALRQRPADLIVMSNRVSASHAAGMLRRMLQPACSFSEPASGGKAAA